MKTVLKPISLLGATTCFIAGWYTGAKRKPIPIVSIDFFTRLGSAVIFTPNRSSISAAPHLLVKDLFPCLATVAPAPAATIDAVVLTFTVFILSPPVPTMSSTRPVTLGFILMANCLIT